MKTLLVAVVVFLGMMWFGLDFTRSLHTNLIQAIPLHSDWANLVRLVIDIFIIGAGASLTFLSALGFAFLVFAISPEK